MPSLEFSCDIAAPLEAVWAFHEDVQTLFVLTPPYIKVRLENKPEPARLGVHYSFIFTRFGISLRWTAEYTAFDPPYSFTDRQVPGKGPFAAWEHRHELSEIPSGTRLTDHVTYTPPLGLLGRFADVLFLRRDLKRMFAYRHRITKERLEKPSKSTTT